MTIQFNTPTTSKPAATEAIVRSVEGLTRPVWRGFYVGVGKRLLDCILIILSLPIVLPLIGVFAFLVAVNGSSPFYWQQRVGRGGRHFSILKLRTMIDDADEALASYLRVNPKARREWELKQKLCHDPRVTKVGHILRKTSLDELPQLWNVFKGDMSLVGPRPMMVDQKDLYPGELYYELRPGITGLWQVSDRNDTSFADRATFDNKYYCDVSLGMDLSLLARTIGVVLRGTGY
ncbi:sugar transferase [uncultured Shimia sp.]|uniref:sugar transferase n=1 Tax=uncultured Shimia sp. TaxID=573152 RepID=UPI0026062B78|nr:sugar transferase [uncultured Shimia sp.]